MIRESTLRPRQVRAAPIHGNKSHNARQRALDAFRHGQLQVLVATDIAARRRARQQAVRDAPAPDKSGRVFPVRRM